MWFKYFYCENSTTNKLLIADENQNKFQKRFNLSFE